MGHGKFSPSFAAADWQKSTNCTGDKSSFLSMPQHRSQYAKVYTRPCQAQDSEGDQGCPQWGEAAAGLRSDHRTGRGSGRRTADGGWRRPLELLLAWPRVGSGRGWHRTPVGRHRHQASSLSWHIAATQAAQDSSEIRVGTGCDCNWKLSNLLLSSHLNSSLPSFIQQRRSFCKQSKLGSDIEHPPTS